MNKLEIFHPIGDTTEDNAALCDAMVAYATSLFETYGGEVEITIKRNVDLMFGDSYFIEAVSERTLYKAAHEFMINRINDGTGVDVAGVEVLSFIAMRCVSNEDDVSAMIASIIEKFNTEFQTEMCAALQHQAGMIGKLMNQVEIQASLIQQIGVDKFPDIVRELINHIPYENQDECKESINAILARTVN